MPPLSPTLKQTFLDTIPALRGWRACVDSFTQDSQLRKYIAECDSLITIQEVKKLRTSKPYVEGAAVMKKAEKGGNLSLRDYTLARDYLLCRLTLATGTRREALNNCISCGTSIYNIYELTTEICLLSGCHTLTMLTMCFWD